MIQRLHILTLVLVLLSALTVRSETYIYTHYDSENGLCNNHVHDMVQDRDGFIWIATHYGISRFDGHKFSNFIISEYPSMQRNDMYHAFVTDDGRVAFAGSRGVINSYNRDLDRFEAIALGDSVIYDDITGYTMSHGEALITTSGGVYSKTSGYRYNRIIPAMDGVHTLEAVKDAYNRYWIGTFSGVTVTDADGKPDSELADLRNLGVMINNILLMNDGRLMLCSSVGAAWLIKLDNKGGMEKSHKIETPFTGISEIKEDSDGCVWIGTPGEGLWHAIPSGESFRFEKIVSPVKYKNETEKITALTIDTQKNIWIGTQNSGIFRLRKISDASTFSSADVGLSKTTGSCICISPNGDLMFGTDGHGIFIMDSSFTIKKHITTADGLPCNNVLSMKQDGTRTVCSFWGGEVAYITPSYNIETEKYAGLDSPTNMIKNLLVDNSGKIWACTAGDGVYTGRHGRQWERLTLKDTTMVSSHPDVWINNALQAPDGRIWIITSRTVWMQDENTFVSIYPDIDKTHCHNPMQIYAGIHNSSGELFAATSNGVIHFSADGLEHDFLDFIPTGSYKSIATAPDGTILTAGSNGIISIQYDKKKYNTVFADVKDFDHFTACASFTDKKGRIYFGNNDGFTAINLNTHEKAEAPSVFWENLFIHGEKIKPHSEILPKSMYNTEKLSLKYSQASFRLTFNIIDYTSHSYTSEYRISPIDTEWTPLGYDRDIDISHLSAGNYTIEMRFEKDGKPIDTHLSLNVEIMPPWWQSWWFRLLCTLLAAGIASLAVYLRFLNISSQKKRLEEMVRTRTAELDCANRDLKKQKEETAMQNEALLHTLKDKDRLISVIAHDLKNPMFAIVCTLEDIIRKRKSENNTETQTLKNVHNSAKKLQKEMVNLLDWITNRNGSPECDFKEINAAEITMDVTELLNGMARKKNIQISTYNRLKHLSVADVRMLSTIIKNALSNALKFTPVGGDISITLSEKDGMTEIEIQDSGTGMNQEQLDKLLSGTIKSTAGTNNETGHGLGFRIIRDFVEKNNGTLHISSALGAGTKLMFTLPTAETKITEEKTGEETTEESGTIIDLNIYTNMLKDKSILIVDDDPMLLLHLKSVLEPYVSVNLATDGRDGLVKAKEIMPDLTISDIDMPHMDGLEMYRQMLSNNLTSHIPLLFISANGNDDMRITGLNSGAIDYITKPFDDNELLIKVCNFLTIIKKQQIQFMKSVQEPSENNVKPVEPNPLLKNLFSLIKENYNDPEFSIDTITTRLGMSKSTLSRRLKSLTDKTPMELLSDFRLSEAKKLLKTGNVSVSEAAYSTGFNDPLYFSKKFKDAFGISPSKIQP